MSSRRAENHGGGSTTFVTELQPNDVLMGRGAPISDNRGNIRFLSLIREKCCDYHDAATRKDKDAIARQIVNTIHGRNGLFLRKIVSPEEATDLGVPPKVAAWTTADEKTVLSKIKQALRDRGLEVRGQAPPPPQDNANDTELPSTCDDEELGADEMVAHGLSPHETQQPPPAKRAKIQRFQDQSPSDLVRQTPAAAVSTMPPPTQVPAAGINQFQGALESMQKPHVPLFANFSQGFNHGTVNSQPFFTPYLPHLSTEQNWNSNAAAGLNISPGVVYPNLQLGGGKLQADFRAAFATHSQADANAHLQVKGGELKIDKKLSASAEGPNNETTGEIALRVACDVCEMGQTPSVGVKLDPIELCLLSVLNSRGLPTWSSTQFQNGDVCSTSNNTPCPFTWSDVGNHLVQEVQSFLSRKTSNLFPNDTPGQHGLAIAGFISRLGSLASAYSKNPTSLACMTVMLLEKLRMSTAVGATASVARMTYPGMDCSSGRAAFWTADSESSREGRMFGRGSSNDPRGVAMDSLATMPEEFLFQTYITTELSLWAASLNITDEVGFPVPYSSHDFVANFPQYAQYDVFSTAAALDRFGCQAVLCQVTYLTRLRSLFQQCSSDQMLSILRTSSLTPSWGSSIDEETALLDMSLLQALLVNGFNGLFDSTKADDLLGILLRQKSIMKPDVERRLIQLTRLLHKHVQSAKITQVINQQAANLVEMIGR